MHTAFRSVELDGVTQLARTTTIQYQYTGCDLRVWPEATGVTMYRLGPTSTRWRKWNGRARIPVSEDNVFSSLCRGIAIPPEYKLNNISYTISQKSKSMWICTVHHRNHL